MKKIFSGGDQSFATFSMPYVSAICAYNICVYISVCVCIVHVCACVCIVHVCACVCVCARICVRV